MTRPGEEKRDQVTDGQVLPDIQRWSNLTDNDDWNARARLLAPWLDAPGKLLDVGCGTQYLRQIVGEERYRGLDCVPRTPDSFVVDLNGDDIPEAAFDGVTTATFLGVLEYCLDPGRHVLRASERVERLILTYTPVDFVADPAVREENGWKSALSLKEMEALLERTGFGLLATIRHNTQALYILDRDAGARTDEKEPPRNVSIAKSRTIVLSGFFGRGNAGDEAILQVLTETVSQVAKPVLAVDRTGAYEGFWDWYPYKGLEIIHQGDLARLCQPDVIGLHVGGGGLPPGFGGAHVTISRVRGLPCVTSGVDEPYSLYLGGDNHRLTEDRARWSLFQVRTGESLKRLQEIGITADLGADWASILEIDDSGEPAFDGITLILRELPMSMLDRKRLEEYRRLIAAFRRFDIPVRLLPFCPEDERYINRIDAAWTLPVERHWWNPRRMREVIAKSRGIVSVGRLHPLIFAATAGTPTAVVDIDCERHGISRERKLRDHAVEFDIPYFSDVPEFLDAIVRHNDTPLGGHVKDDYRQRFEAMRSSVLAQF